MTSQGLHKLRSHDSLHLPSSLQPLQQRPNIAYRVHILNPDGVHRAVKHDPFLVWPSVGAALPHVGGQDTVSPPMGVFIKFTVQLPHCGGLGVQGHHTNLLKAACAAEAGHGLQGSGQQFFVGSLAGKVTGVATPGCDKCEVVQHMKKRCRMSALSAAHN